jgi:hypothetical protein
VVRRALQRRLTSMAAACDVQPHPIETGVPGQIMSFAVSVAPDKIRGEFLRFDRCEMLVLRLHRLTGR